MSPEQTDQEKVREALKEVEVAMLENIEAGKAEVEATLRKKNARYKLLKAQERLSGIYYEIIQ